MIPENMSPRKVSVDLPQTYDVCTDCLRNIEQSDIDKWEVIEASYRKLWCDLCDLVGTHRKEFWNQLVKHNLVVGEDTSPASKLIRPQV